MPTDNKFVLWALITLIPAVVSTIVAVVTVTLQFGIENAKLRVGLDALKDRVARDETLVENYHEELQKELRSLRKSVTNSREYVRDQANAVREEFNSQVIKHLNDSDLHARKIKIEQER